MKNLTNTAILTALLCATALNAQAMGKNPEETLPQNPPAHVDSPVIPVSRETARRMLTLQTAPNLDKFAGKWILTSELLNIDYETSVGRHQESGLRKKEYANGIESLTIQRTLIPHLPEQAQSQYFLTIDIEEASLLEKKTYSGQAQSVDISENSILFRTGIEAEIAYNYKDYYAAQKHLSDSFGGAYNFEKISPKNWSYESRFFIDESRIESVLKNRIHDIDFLYISNVNVYRKTKCGISATDNNLLICSRASTHGKFSDVNDFRTYKRITE